MKNWALLGLHYDIHPSPQNFIKFRWAHFLFCQKADKSITASLYLDNLTHEVNHELAKQISVSKKSLTLSVIKNILTHNETKQKLIALYENQHIADNDIKAFLNIIAALSQYTANGDETNYLKEETIDEAVIPVRTYIIATHIYLELNHNETHYQTLIRNTASLKEFIESKFKAKKLSDRISGMKNFSYKKILTEKHNDGPKGQLKPQLKQIASNPKIFGDDVSEFAENILVTHFEY